MLSSFFRSLITITILSLTTPSLVDATPCVAFDSNFNLYALGFGGKDFQLGTQNTWNSTVTPKDVTANGRPPFDGKQTTCYLSQFLSAIYVLDGDASDSTSVHIYDATAGSWSTQKVNSGGPDPDSLVAILDHDTNVFYAVDNGNLSFLNLAQEKAANSTPLSWVLAETTPYGQAYKPTMALAQNHVHFIDTPNAAPGTAEIYVIHFDFFQPTPQAYPDVSGGPLFPETNGKTASFFKPTSVQENFAYIPSDASSTYVINVQENNTVTFAGPTDKSDSTYAASLTALVQLTSNGSIFFLPFNPDEPQSGTSATWTRIAVEGLPAITSSSTNGTSSGNTTSPNTGSGSNGSGSGSGSNSSGTGSKSGSNSGSMSISLSMTVTLFGAILCLATL